MKRPQPLLNHDAFFVREKRAWSNLAATWCSLPEEAQLKSGACGEWSIKDVINHVAACQEVAIEMIGKLQSGQFANPGLNIDRFNAKHYEADKDRSLTVSRRRQNKSRRELLALLQIVPEEDLLYEFGRQAIGWWAKWSTYAHYEEHMNNLMAFRQQHG